ncbi:MAG: glycosyltransferase family 4 protein [Patescibacteria group bacterium]
MPASILILKFPYSSLLGGGELHTVGLVENLKKKGFNFYLVSSCSVLLSLFKKENWPSEKIWLGKEPVTPFSVLLFFIFSPYFIFRLFFILLWYKIKYRTKILYCLSLTEKLLAFLAFFLGYRIFWIEHQYPEAWLALNPFLFLYRLNSRFAKIIAVSYAVQNRLIELGIKPRHIKVIYNGIDLDQLKAQNAKLKTTTKNLKLVIGAACRLSKEKAVDDLIRAFAKIIKKYQNVELWIAGTGPERKNLENLVMNLGLNNKVKFFGWQEDIYNFLNKLDIFALTPYRRESFGLAVAQAQARGLAAVVTNIGGLGEVVENEKTGFVVKAKDINAIVAAITKLIKNSILREKMGKAGQERVKKLFSQEKMIEEFEKEFKPTNLNVKAQITNQTQSSKSKY